MTEHGLTKLEKNILSAFEAVLTLEGTPGECPRWELMNLIRELKRDIEAAKEG